MAEHFIDWYLVKPGDSLSGGSDVVPKAQLMCTAPPDAPCRDRKWEEVIDTSGYPLAEHECYATVMIEDSGAADLWAGAKTHQISGREIEVKQVGDDWVWKYTDEQWAEVPDVAS